MRQPLVAALLLAGCHLEFSISPKDEVVDTDDPGLSLDPGDGLGGPIALDPALPDTDLPDTDVVQADPDTDVVVPDDTDVAVLDTAGIAVGPAATVPLYNLSSDLQWPESGAWDPDTRAFYVGSLELGHVLRVGAAGGESVFFEDPTPGESWQTYGVKADVQRRLLYVCARRDHYPFPDWFTWVIDLDTGTRVHTLDMATVGTRAECRDFAVAPDGVVYVSDRSNPWIHRIDPSGPTMTRFADDPRLQRSLWGLDGIVVTPAGDAILVNKSKPGDLLRVSVADPTQIVQVALTGASGFGLAAGHGLDGMAWFGGDLWIAAVNRLVQITPDSPDWTSGNRQVWTSVIDGVSALTVADGELYAINGDPFAWTLGIQADLPFEISRVVLPLVAAP